MPTGMESAQSNHKAAVSPRFTFLVWIIEPCCHKLTANVQFGGGFPHPSTWPVNGITLSVPFSGTSVFVPGYQCE